MKSQDENLSEETFLENCVDRGFNCYPRIKHIFTDIHGKRASVDYRINEKEGSTEIVMIFINDALMLRTYYQMCKICKYFDKSKKQLEKSKRNRCRICNQYARSLEMVSGIIKKYNLKEISCEIYLDSEKKLKLKVIREFSYQLSMETGICNWCEWLKSLP